MVLHKRCELKFWSCTTTEYLDMCQNDTDVPMCCLRIMLKIEILQWNRWAKFHVVMTCDSIILILGTLLIEQSLYQWLCQLAGWYLTHWSATNIHKSTQKYISVHRKMHKLVLTSICNIISEFLEIHDWNNMWPGWSKNVILLAFLLGGGKEMTIIINDDDY